MAGLDLTPALIEREYQRLGHCIGWRFLTSPESTIDTAAVALVTANPGGSVDDTSNPQWSVENGNAYLTESWRGKAIGRDKLQIQVQRLFEVLRVDIHTVLSGYFVPFRSSDWKGLRARDDSLAFGRELWTTKFAKSPARTIIAFGYDIEAEMCALLGAKHLKEALRAFQVVAGIKLAGIDAKGPFKIKPRGVTLPQHGKR